MSNLIGGPTTVVKQLEDENRALRVALAVKEERRKEREQSFVSEVERLREQADMRMRGWDLAIERAVAAERQRDGLAKALSDILAAQAAEERGEDGGDWFVHWTNARAALAALTPKEDD